MKRGRTRSAKQRATALSPVTRAHGINASQKREKNVGRSRPPAYPERRLRVEIWSENPEVRIGHFEIAYRLTALTHSDLATQIAEQTFELVSKKVPRDHFCKAPEALDWTNANTYKASNDDIPF